MSNQLSPIGVFWDIENCSVPKWKSALAIVQVIRDKFFAGCREAEFMCVCDTTKENKQVIQELNCAQVNVVHIDALSKNAADDKLKQSLRRFSDIHPSPATVVLISSDINFASELSDLRHRKSYYVILIHSQQVHQGLVVCANEHHLFEDLVRDIPCRTPSKTIEGKTELEITGYLPDTPEKVIHSRLRKLSTNCGGKIISITREYAVLRFASSTDAEKARKRMDGENICGSKIQVDFSVSEKSTDTGTSNNNNNQHKGSNGGTKKFIHMRPKSDPQVFKMDQKNGMFKAALDQVRNTHRAVSEERQKSELRKEQQKQQKQQKQQDQQKPQEQQQEKETTATYNKKYPVLQRKQNKEQYQQAKTQNEDKGQQVQQPRTQTTEKKVIIAQNQNRENRNGSTGKQQNQTEQDKQEDIFQTSVTTDNLFTSLNHNSYQSYNRSYSNGNSTRETTPNPYDNIKEPELKQVVDKFSRDNKSSRQVLMLQQQLFQEGHEQNLHDQQNEFYSEQTLPYGNSYTDNYLNNRNDYTYQAYENLNKSFSEFGYHSNSSAYSSYRHLFDGKNYRSKYYHGDNNTQSTSSTYSSLVQQQWQTTDRYSPCNSQVNGYDLAQQDFDNDRVSPAYLRYQNTFRPIQTPSPLLSTESSSPCHLEASEWDSLTGPVELLVSNLDYNISAKEWKKILFTTFHPHVTVLNVHVKTQPDNTSIGMVKVPSIEEARFAISQFHRKKIGYKRIHVTLKTDDAQRAATSTRMEAIALLSEAKDNVLPLFKFIELFDKRYHRTISVAELYKMRDTIEIKEQGGSGRMVYMATADQQQQQQSELDNSDSEEILEQPVCHLHCPDGSPVYAEAVNSNMLPNVRMSLKTLAPQVHSLLQSHEGNMPLMSFPACYGAEFVPVPIAIQGGVPLEHLISCVPGIQIQVSKCGVKKVHWAENRPPSSTDSARLCNSPLLSQQLNQISREMIDLLRHSPHCKMPFSKFIPSYHHFFGKQCRVADYGYNRLKDLFEAIPHVLQVLGTGDRKLLTLSHRAQVRRFSSDLVKLLKLQPGRQVPVNDLQTSFSKMINKPFDVSEYGVCYLDDILSEVPTSTAVVMDDGGEMVITIPRKDQTPEEVERTKQFSLEVVDLLKHNPQCRMPFNKFIPSYHHHFGRQCRVSDYGFNKLLDLFEAIPHVVEIEEEGEERLIHLTEPELRKILADQIVGLLKLQRNHWLPLHHLMSAFTCHYGFNIPLYDFNVDSEEELINKMKHVIKVQMINRCKYVMLVDRSETPKLAHQVLQVLMDQSCGSLPLMELCSRYKSMYGEECDINKLRNDLLDFVQVIGDDESGVISLTSLQTFARDVRILLQKHGRIYLPEFDKMYKEYFTVDIKPALYGCPTITSLVMKIPHVVKLLGKGINKYIELSDDLTSTVPGGSPDVETCITCRISPHRPTRPASETQSSDSGVTDTNADDDDIILHKEIKSLGMKPVDILSIPVPSAVPSPDLQPVESCKQAIDLMHFQSVTEIADAVYFLSEEEKKGQKTPLCRTPTSDLLRLAAQCLISHPPPVKGATSSSPTQDNTTTQASGGISMSTNSAQDLLKLIHGGWWKVSPSQEQEIKSTVGTAEVEDKDKVGVNKNDTNNNLSVHEDKHNEVLNTTGSRTTDTGVTTNNNNKNKLVAGKITLKQRDSSTQQQQDNCTTAAENKAVHPAKPVSRQNTPTFTSKSGKNKKGRKGDNSTVSHVKKNVGFKSGSSSGNVVTSSSELIKSIVTTSLDSTGNMVPDSSASMVPCSSGSSGNVVPGSSGSSGNVVNASSGSSGNVVPASSRSSKNEVTNSSQSARTEAPGSYKSYVRELERSKAITEGRSSSPGLIKQSHLTIPKSKVLDCVAADDSMSYENMFHRDPPLDTSSVKSDNSTASEKSQESPKKSPRKTRIAARFDLPMATN